MSSKSLFNLLKFISADSSCSVFFALIANKSTFGSFANASAIPLPNPTIKSFIPPIYPVSTPIVFLIILINPLSDSRILGKLVTNHPISIIPKKSSILPRNPFVLLVTTFPCFFVTPDTVEDSSSSSLCFLLTFSLLFLKNSLSLPISVCLKLLLSLVCFMIFEAISLDFDNPFVKLVTESLIELILIDDLSNEFLLDLIDIIPPR